MRDRRPLSDIRQYWTTRMVISLYTGRRDSRSMLLSLIGEKYRLIGDAQVVNTFICWPPLRRGILIWRKICFSCWANLFFFFCVKKSGLIVILEFCSFRVNFHFFYWGSMYVLQYLSFMRYFICDGENCFVECFPFYKSALYFFLSFTVL